MTLRLSSLLIVSSSVLAALGCSAGSPAGSTTSRGNGSGGTGITTGGGGTGNTIITDTGMKDPLDMRDVPVRKKVCDAAGTTCTCLRLAMLGTLASSAVDTDSQAFVTWLNGNSDGTATLTSVPMKPTIDAAFLAQYDILLFANVNSWTFSADEKSAIQKWVTDTGGGIITLTGFSSMPPERDSSSQAISFSGLNYGTASSTTPAAAPASGEKSPVYYKGGSVNLKQCLYWNGSVTTTHSSPFITTPLKFTPQTGGLAKLTLGLDYVGAFIGWPVTAPAGATVLATDPVTGGNMAVALEYNGKGRIVAFGDEWVIFSNEWLPTGMPSNMQMDSGNMCWVPASGSTPGFFHSVESLYQTKQFWFNMINWVAPPNECNFVVNDPDVVVK